MHHAAFIWDILTHLNPLVYWPFSFILNKKIRAYGFKCTCELKRNAHGFEYTFALKEATKLPRNCMNEGLPHVSIPVVWIIFDLLRLQFFFSSFKASLFLNLGKIFWWKVEKILVPFPVYNFHDNIKL